MGPNPVSIRLDQYLDPYLDPFFGFLTHFHLVPVLSSSAMIIRKTLEELKLENNKTSILQFNSYSPCLGDLLINFKVERLEGEIFSLCVSLEMSEIDWSL